MTTTPPYRISLHGGGAVLQEYHGEAMGFLPRAVLMPPSTRLP